MEQHTAIVPYGAAELRARVNDLRLSVMQQDIDFGKIPGVDKMVLLKPGAEKLCAEFGFYPRFEQVSVVENFDTSPPLFHYRYRAVLYRVATGEAIAEGIGSCNSREKKYRYRQSERVCPECGKPAIIKGKSEYGGGWVCFKRKDGCGAKFSDNDPSIIGQEVGQVDNPDIFDQVNTLDKMAQKRALIAAVLIATNASAYFTQDLEDDVIEGHYEEMRSEPSKQAATTPKQSKPTSTGANTPEQQKTAFTPPSDEKWWTDRDEIARVRDETGITAGLLLSKIGAQFSDFPNADGLINKWRAEFATQ